MCSSARGVSPTASITTSGHAISSAPSAAAGRASRRARRRCPSTSASSPAGASRQDAPGVGLDLEVRGERAPRPPSERARASPPARALRGVLAARRAPARGSARATRARAGSPPARASRQVVDAVDAAVRRARAPGAGSAARRTRRAARAPPPAGRLDAQRARHLRLHDRHARAASRASAATGSSNCTARWHASRQSPIRSGASPPSSAPPARPSRSCSRARARARRRIRLPVSRSSASSPSATALERRAARPPRAASPQPSRQPSGSVEICPRRRRRAAAARGAARGRACSRAAPGSAQSGR